MVNPSNEVSNRDTSSTSNKRKNNQTANRRELLNNNQCPDCESEDGYWTRGSVAEFDYRCNDCMGVFDGDSTERRAEQTKVRAK